MKFQLPSLWIFKRNSNVVCSQKILDIFFLIQKILIVEIWNIPLILQIFLHDDIFKIPIMNNIKLFTQLVHSTERCSIIY